MNTDKSLPRPRSYGRRRAAVLALVYVLMVLHITHWKIAGKTLAPLELNEVMYTLELGLVTAGFLFMAMAMVSVLIFGRFFCSWGCHILALQDLCAWLLAKVRIKPRPVRSRLLLIVPPAALFYMFVWPQLKRLTNSVWPQAAELIGQTPEFTWRLHSDSEGWASFVTTDFWRNLPGPWITGLTFFVCGFAIIYVLGTRAFCQYGCPYGALFGLADRVAPGRIVLKGECIQCARCTAACTSHLRVHEEIKRFGTVVDPGCLKDLDCVSVCPTGGLAFGFRRPAFFKSWSSKGKKRRLRHDLSWGEELLVGGVFIATLVVFRGLYDSVPFLMTLGLGGVFGYVAVTSLRLVSRPNLRQLKLKGRLTPSGRWAAVGAIALWLLFGHSAFIRYHEFQGGRAFDRLREHIAHAEGPLSEDLVEDARTHLRLREAWGLYVPDDLDRKWAEVSLHTRAIPELSHRLERILQRSPGDHLSRLRLGEALTVLGRFDQAEEELRAVTTAEADGGIPPETLRECRAAAHVALGELLGNQGRLEDSVAEFRRSLELLPDSAVAHYNLAVILASQGKGTEALPHYREAARLNPTDVECHNNLGHLLAALGDFQAAAHHLQEALRINPGFAAAHFNLGRVLLAQDRRAEAEAAFRRAAQLDPRYPVDGPR